MMEQLVPRTAFLSLTIHVMMLVPLLKFIKIDLQQSIIPYLYLGPLVFMVPYIIFYLWDNNILKSISFIDNYVSLLCISIHTFYILLIF